jgi:hypothetical protein
MEVSTMYQFPIGVMLESFRLPTPEAVKKAAETERHACNVERSSLHVHQILPVLGARDREAEAIRVALCKKYGFPK